MATGSLWAETGGHLKEVNEEGQETRASLGCGHSVKMGGSQHLQIQETGNKGMPAPAHGGRLPCSATMNMYGMTLP